MKLSRFGEGITQGAGIVQLMADLGEAMAVRRDMLMLGGGNPGRIPAMEAAFRARMQAMLEDGDAFERLVGTYGPPQGDPDFIAALARLLRRECGWDVGPANIAVTNGSQSASFILLNLFAGPREAGTAGRVLLPLTPEYIGYADQGLGPDFFVAARPTIEILEPPLFKYRVDFDQLPFGPDTAVLLASRPTNPTGNVLDDGEVQRLRALARSWEVPLILDNAYGTPFPGILFTEATPQWDEHTVVCLSLSKLGLPGVRTGIVVAREEIISAVAGANAVLNLTTGGFGPALAVDLVRSGEILRLGREVIGPFYRDRAWRAVDRLTRALEGYPLRIHRPEGAIFLWLWFEGLPISTGELYRRLRERGVLVIAGQHFFPGLPDDGWRHPRECIRVTYSQAESMVARGLDLIADEVRRAYDV